MKNATLKQAAKILSIFDETPVEQVQAILKSGLMADLRDGNISTVNRDAFRKILGLKSLDPEKTLLKFIGTVAVPATAEKFVAKEHFVKDTSEKARVKISFFGGNFAKWFLGKVEFPLIASTLSYHRLMKSSIDSLIINKLGGETKAETTLAEMFALMEKQANGKSGALLTNDYANIFYICDIKGVLRAVRCYWDDDGWSVAAYEIDDSTEWNSASKVFSRNSLESQD